MDITNKFGLPQPFLDFARNDKYSKGKADISVTTLIDSPRVNQMRKHYASDRQADVTDMVWPLFGTAVHHILESSKEKDVLLEERLFVDIDGWTLSNYPQAPVAMVEIPLWSDQRRIEYAKHRVEAHQQAELRYDLEEDLEDKFVKCYPSDQWKRDDSWAVKKKGLKRAMRVFENEPDADAFAAGQSVPVEIEHRAGELVRCKGNYCGVAEFCSQYKKKEKKIPSCHIIVVQTLLCVIVTILTGIEV